MLSRQEPLLLKSSIRKGPIDASNVMYYDSKAKAPTKVGYKMVGDKKVRVFKKNRTGN